MTKFKKEFYLCDKCNVVHYKHRKSDGGQIQIFKDHLEHAIEITDSQRLIFQFKQNWRKQTKKVRK